MQVIKNAILLGLGKIGLDYDLSPSGFFPNQTMTHLNALLKSDIYRICAVADVDSTKREFVRNFYFGPAVSDLKQLKVLGGIDLLTLATPTSTHLAVLRDLPANLVPKIILIEKPVGVNLTECIDIHDWASSNSVTVFVNYFRRHLPSVKQARDYISQLELGSLCSVSVDSYGSMLNIFSHFMDLGMTLTNRKLYCGCPKSSLINNETKKSLVCNSCKVEYSFVGLHGPKKTSQSRICFENYSIDIHLDGMEVVITKSDGTKLVEFRTPESLYLNYQSLVYSDIGHRSEDWTYLIGLDQAIQIHKFVESMVS